VTTAIGSNSLLGNAGTANTRTTAVAKSADSTGNEPGATSQRSGSDSVTLSDAAKAYLAANASAATDAGASSNPVSGSDTDELALAQNARAWLDAQYNTLGISSAMVDGQVAVDMTGQSRETLAAIAANSQGLFTSDESAAASSTLQARFIDSMMPHVVMARHTGDYASLYQAASDYLDQAGADERATDTWQKQKQAVEHGLAAARQAFGKAPDTGNADDPIRALLDATSQSDAPATDATDPATLAANARAMLDAQANKARDEGEELVFSSGRNGVQADFSNFDNQSLAIVSLNQDGAFSADEARSANKQLDARNRASLLSAFDAANNGGTVQDASLALLKQYSSMSDAEKAALGYTDDFRDQIIQSYRTVSMFQGADETASSPNLASYL
jgi:hypothetical protein